MKQNWKRVAAGILAAVLSLCGTTTAWAAEDSALVTSAYGSAENAEEPQEGQAGIPEAGAGEETQAEPESGADAEMPVGAETAAGPETSPGLETAAEEETQTEPETTAETETQEDPGAAVKEEALPGYAGRAADVSVSYSSHVQTYGWQKAAADGVPSGTSGQAKRLEGITIRVSGNPNLGIRYTTHCQTYGWLPWSADGEMNGTEGEAKRLEAVKIRLTGADAGKYDVYYRVHAQTYGWLSWAKNGQAAGTAGEAKRLEAVQIVIMPAGEAAPDVYEGISPRDSRSYIDKSGSADPDVAGETDTNVSYRTHVQSYGWQGWRYNGGMSGTSGQAKRLEGIYVRLTNKQYGGGIQYRTHVQKEGWQGWKSEGEMSGTSGKARRLEAIQIRLTGEMAEHYDVYYRVHAQSYGWLGWAKNGESAGTEGLAKRLEGIQIVIMPAGEAVPDVYEGISPQDNRPYIDKSSSAPVGSATYAPKGKVTAVGVDEPLPVELRSYYAYEELGIQDYYQTTTKSDGSFAFDPITFTQVGTYRFVIVTPPVKRGATVCNCGVWWWHKDIGDGGPLDGQMANHFADHILAGEPDNYWEEMREDSSIRTDTRSWYLDVVVKEENGSFVISQTVYWNEEGTTADQATFLTVMA